MYKKVLKYNQVTYGMPYQLNIPFKIKRVEVLEADEVSTDNLDQENKLNDLPPDPEELLEKAKQECDFLIKEAGIEAEKLLEKAELEADKKAEALFEEAWQNGYAEGMEASRTQNEAILAQTEQIRQSAAEEHDSILASMETEILKLVVDIARKVVAGELETDEGVILQLIKDGLSCCSNKSSAVIKVSPEDYDYLNDHDDQLAMISE
ncbi:MAG: FliH/SctL family protein, partial [Clostridia bacterium]|nr:FliH/SctL family protein [Clostridia bacterium]